MGSILGHKTATTTASTPCVAAEPSVVRPPTGVNAGQAVERQAGEPGAGHALAQAALFQKILFQPAKLLVQQIIRLVNQADEKLVSLSSASLEVPEMRLPSAMFLLPLRAACTIWSWVRDLMLMTRSQKRTVAS